MKLPVEDRCETPPASSETLSWEVKPLGEAKQVHASRGLLLLEGSAPEHTRGEGSSKKIQMWLDYPPD